MIVPYRPELRGAFRSLNLEWLEGNGLLEPADLVTLDDPEGQVLAGGGEILFVEEEGVALGTCAAVVVDASTVELAKLAVAPAARGRGLGRALCVEVIAFARRRGAEKVVLTSARKLAAAVRLYERLGFVHLPMPAGVPYATADVYMELQIAR